MFPLAKTAELALSTSYNEEDSHIFHLSSHMLMQKIGQKLNR